MQPTRTAAPQETSSPVVELRQYTLHPGKRDILIDTFEREFIQAQESAGARVIGQFRDLDRPDRFVWLRGFADMPTRARALETFYTSATWKAHRDAVNETLVDFANVLLLRRARPQSGFTVDEQPPARAGEKGEGLIAAAVYCLNEPDGTELLEFFEKEIEPQLRAAGGDTLALFVSEKSANNYPRLPIREGENAFVWFARFSDRAAGVQSIQELFHRELPKALARRLKEPAQLLKLAPASRSALQA